MSDRFNITVEELATYLDNLPKGGQLIDVREPEEVAIAPWPGFAILPLSQFAQWSHDPNPNPAAPL